MQTELKKYITENNLSYREFGRRVGVAPSTVFGWVHGRRKPHPRIALKIQKATKGFIPLSHWGYALERHKKVIRT